MKIVLKDANKKPEIKNFLRHLIIPKFFEVKSKLCEEALAEKD